VSSYALWVLIEGDSVPDLKHRVYVTRWGGYDIDLAVLTGPRQLIERMRDLQPKRGDAASDGHWPDIAPEGAVLVDMPRRGLVFFSVCGDDGALDLGYRRALAAAISEVWTGWTVTWATDELDDLAARVGVEAPAGRPDRDDAATFRLAAPDDARNNYRPWHYGLLTVRDAQGGCRAWLASAQRGFGLVHLAWLGQDLLARPPDDQDLPAMTGVPGHGLHVDLAARRIGWWTAQTAPGLRRNLSRLWPGWDAECWNDRIEDQLARGDAALHAVPAIDVAGGFDRLRARIPRVEHDLETHLAAARRAVGLQAGI